MAFSALLNLGLGAVGMWQAGRQHDAAMQQRAYEMEQMRRQQGVFNYMGQRAQMDLDEQNAKLDEWEQMNRLLAQQERQFQIDMMAENRGLIDEQRQYQIDRQIEMDREAARMQAMQIEQLLRNQQIAENERRFAEEQLQNLQQIAAGEREDDMRRFYEERATAEAEREFVLQQYYGAQDEGRARQSREQEMYDRLLGQVTGMQRAVGMAAADLGAMPDAPRMTKEDLDSEISRRQEAYQSDVDRAATKVASQNEANLIRAGLDGSTTGNARRGDITRRIADEYQSARDRAYDDALAYITGQQDMLMSGYNADVQRRGNVLQETAGVHGAGLEELRNMPGVSSLEDIMLQAGRIPSGVYTRGISSAGVDPRIAQSAQYNGQVSQGGLSDYDVSAWDYGNDWAYLDSAIQQPITRQLPDPMSYYTAAGNIGGSMMNAANQDLRRAQDRSAGAADNFFGSLQQVVADSPGLNNWFDNTGFGQWWNGPGEASATAGGTGGTVVPLGDMAQTAARSTQTPAYPAPLSFGQNYRPTGFSTPYFFGGSGTRLAF